MSLALLCPGQGAQHAAMFDRVRDVAAAQPVLDATDELLGRDAFAAAAAADRFDNAKAQPLLCAASLAHWQGLREALPTPTVIAGYSIGELAAHAIVNASTPRPALPWPRSARLMDAASPDGAGLLAVLGLGRIATQRLCDAHGAFIAIANGDDHFILGVHGRRYSRWRQTRRPSAPKSVRCRSMCPRTRHCW